MKRPLDPNRPIDPKRRRRWTNSFGAYRYQVSEQSIIDWLGQFSKSDLDLAARILDVVDFYSVDRISTAYRSSLAMIPGWSADEGERTGKWRFSGFTTSAGESGDAMMHRFRVANRLDGKKYNSLFIYKSQILLEGLGQDDTIVLIDDFVGSGNSVCEAWNNTFQELLTGIGRVYLLVVAAVQKGRKRVCDETLITCIATDELDDQDNLFHETCGVFSEEEKDVVLKYCKKAKKKEPRGYADCGLVITFQHRCPNNSIPILHATHEHWFGLFPRHG